jgi:hypothetical protein
MDLQRSNYGGPGPGLPSGQVTWRISTVPPTGLTGGKCLDDNRPFIGLLPHPEEEGLPKEDGSQRSNDGETGPGYLNAAHLTRLNNKSQKNFQEL